MLDDAFGIRSRLATFTWGTSTGPTEPKLRRFSEALDRSLREAGALFGGRIHLAFSGGIDSTLLLYRLLSYGFPVDAHTVVPITTHPDAVAARRATEVAPYRKGRLKWFMHVIHREVDADPVAMLYDACNQTIVSGEGADVLFGGYSMHRKKGAEGFRYHQGDFVQNRLDALEAHPNRILTPYLDAGVMAAASAFSFDELVDKVKTKKPIYTLAGRAYVPGAVLTRNKSGLGGLIEQSV